MRHVPYGWNRLMCCRIISWRWKITSGRLAPAPVVRTLRFILISEKNVDAASPPAALDATVTVSSKYGIWSLRSMTARRTVSTIFLHTRILIRAAVWNALLPLCRIRKQTLRQIFSIRLSNIFPRFLMYPMGKIPKRTFHLKSLQTMRVLLRS